MLKKAYAASAFSDAAASSAELDRHCQRLIRVPADDLPDYVDEVFEELGVSLDKEHIGGICHKKRRGYYVGRSEVDEFLAKGYCRRYSRLWHSRCPLANDGKVNLAKVDSRFGISFVQIPARDWYGSSDGKAKVEKLIRESGLAQVR